MPEEVIGKLFENNYDVRTHQQGQDLVTSSVFIGVELEMENIIYATMIPSVAESPYWEEHHDSSLRGESIEIKFALPLRGRDVEVALKEFTNDVIKQGRPSKSDRTSTHVHLDVNTLHPEQLYKFILLSIILERVLYRYAGYHRERSIFCVPFYKAHNHVEAILKFIEGPIAKIPRNVRAVTDDSSRYGGINLAAIRKYGTVEFRMLDAEFNYDKLVYWINVLLSIRQFALTMDMSLVDFHQKLSTDGVSTILDMVFGELKHDLVYPEIEYDILQGIRLAQLIDRSSVNRQLILNINKSANKCNLEVDSEKVMKKKFLKKEASQESGEKEHTWPSSTHHMYVINPLDT